MPTTSSPAGLSAKSFSFVTIDVPGAPGTSVAGINGSGEVAGTYNDSTGPHGFVDDEGIFTIINAPGASAGTFAFGINDGGKVVGTYYDSKGEHGFVDDKGAYTTINVPSATNTVAQGINNRGEIFGFYSDSKGDHGFIASDPAKDVANASLCARNAVDERSLFATAAGSSLPEQWAGGSVGALAYPGSADTAMQLMWSGNG